MVLVSLSFVRLLHFQRDLIGLLKKWDNNLITSLLISQGDDLT